MNLMMAHLRLASATSRSFELSGPPPLKLRRAAFAKAGAHDQDRTDDLVLTKDALYRLSYVGSKNLERETGLEPATNSLEGCDSAN